MKKLIRLTESDLHRIVKESVKKILSEGGNVGRGRFTIYPRSNSIGIVDNKLATSYLYNFRSNSWDRNATPDFGSANISAEELQRAGVQNPQALLDSINQIEGARQQEREQRKRQEQERLHQILKKEREQQRPQQQQVKQSQMSDEDTMINHIHNGTCTREELGYLGSAKGAQWLGYLLQDEIITQSDYDYTWKCIKRGYSSY